MQILSKYLISCLNLKAPILFQSTFQNNQIGTSITPSRRPSIHGIRIKFQTPQTHDRVQNFHANTICTWVSKYLPIFTAKGTLWKRKQCFITLQFIRRRRQTTTLKGLTDTSSTMQCERGCVGSDKGFRNNPREPCLIVRSAEGTSLKSSWVRVLCWLYLRSPLDWTAISELGEIHVKTENY